MAGLCCYASSENLTRGQPEPRAPQAVLQCLPTAPACHARLPAARRGSLTSAQGVQSSMPLLNSTLFFFFPFLPFFNPKGDDPRGRLAPP